MSKASSEKSTEQLENLFAEPTRAYGSLTLEYCEKLASAQFDAARACADMSLAQARRWLDVKDQESLKSVMEGQQKTVQDLGERFKSDAEKLVALNQEYLQKGQQLAENSFKAASNASK